MLARDPSVLTPDPESPAGRLLHGRRGCVGGLKRNGDGDHETAVRVVGEPEAVTIAVQLGKPGAGVRHADALAFESALGHAPAVVGHREQEFVAGPDRAHFDPTGARVRLEPVADRVFNDRLQDETRHLGLQRGGIDREAKLQPVAKADALDLEIFLEERDLVPQRCERRAGM